jgi:hypothetical protein
LHPFVTTPTGIATASLIASFALTELGNGQPLSMRFLLGLLPNAFQKKPEPNTGN